MQGLIKWFSEPEGLGIIEAQEGNFCFGLNDLKGELKEVKAVTFEATAKKISIYDQLMPLPLSIRAINE